MRFNRTSREGGLTVRSRRDYYTAILLCMDTVNLLTPVRRYSAAVFYRRRCALSHPRPMSIILWYGTHAITYHQHCWCQWWMECGNVVKAVFVPETVACFSFVPPPNVKFIQGLIKGDKGGICPRALAFDDAPSFSIVYRI